MPITQSLNYLNARGGLVTEEQFDLLAAPLGRIYSYEDVEKMVRDKWASEACWADDSDYDDWTLAVIGAAITAMLTAERG